MSRSEGLDRGALGRCRLIGDGLAPSAHELSPVHQGGLGEHGLAELCSEEQPKLICWLRSSTNSLHHGYMEFYFQFCGYQ